MRNWYYLSGWIFQTLLALSSVEGETRLSGKFAQTGAVVGSVISGMAVYLLASVLLCRREAAQIFNAVLRRK
jgi:hypothetical protein